MHIYSLRLLTIDIPAYMRTPVNDQTTLARLMSEVSKGRSEEAGTHYEKIVFLHLCAQKRTKVRFFFDIHKKKAQNFRFELLFAWFERLFMPLLPLREPRP